MSKDSSSRAKIGHLGEALVATWLQAQGCQILHQRWHCRWGEIDLIADWSSCDQTRSATDLVRVDHPGLSFIEVKTRNHRNWDANGLLAISSQKQRKLSRAVQAFLANYPNYAEWPCRFDVAAVIHHSHPDQKTAPAHPFNLSKPPALGEPIVLRGGHRLVLEHYLPGAFDFWEET